MGNAQICYFTVRTSGFQIKATKLSGCPGPRNCYCTVLISRFKTYYPTSLTRMQIPNSNS